MCWQATGWAFRAPIESSGAKFVLVALAERAGSEDDDSPTWSCYPSIETIAKYTAQGYRTIQRHLDWLQAEGYISRERRVISKGKLGSFIFTLHRNPIARQNGQWSGSAKVPAKNGAEVVEIGHAKPVIEPTKEPKSSLRSESRASEEDLFGEMPPLPPPKPKREKRQPVHLPKDWVPSAEDRDFALGEGMTDAQVDREASRFKDHWNSTGRNAAKADWPATWRNWIRKTTDDPRWQNANRQSVPSWEADRRRDLQIVASSGQAALGFRHGR